MSANISLFSPHLKMSYTTPDIDCLLASKQKLKDRCTQECLDLLATIADNYVNVIYQHMVEHPELPEIINLKNSIGLVAGGIGFLTRHLTTFGTPYLGAKYTTNFAPNLSLETRNMLAYSTETLVFALV